MVIDLFCGAKVVKYSKRCHIVEQKCRKVYEKSPFFCTKLCIFAPSITYKRTKPMKRFAFKMYLKPGCEEEYQRRHAAIWPELQQQIKAAGVSDYSIFWDKDTNLLFGIQHCEGDATSQDTTEIDPITQKWWDMNADIMEVNPDHSPVTVLLKEMFHMD